MRGRSFGAIARTATILATVLFAGAAAAASKQEYDQCAALTPAEVAIEACTRILETPGEIAQNRAAAYANRGQAYDIKGDRDRALADLNESIRLNPKDANAYNGRGQVYRRKGDYDSAIADYNQSIRLDPAYCFSYIGRSEAWTMKGDYGHAIAGYSEIIRRFPKDTCISGAYNDRCWARTLAGTDLQGALADCNEALRLEPNAAYILNNRGLVQLKLGSFPQAISDYSAAIAQDTKDADSLYGRGIAKVKSGDVPGGDADIAAATSIKPDIAEKYAGYGLRPTAGVKLPDKSQVTVAAPPEPSPSSAAPTYVSRALANFQKGDRLAAIADYRQAFVIDPTRVGDMAKSSAELQTIARAAAEVLDAVVEIAPTGSGTRTRPALGFIIDASGIVVAPQDAIGDAKNVVLAFNDGTKLDATVVGSDARTDIALLKVKTDKQLTVLHFGDSAKVTIGQKLAALANASIAEDLLKLGPVTALDQNLGLTPYDKFIAIDLAVGHVDTNDPIRGSGGPIFNEKGEVVGIHIATSAGKFYAAPAADIAPIIDQLRQHGEVQRGWIGVQIQRVTDELAGSLNITPPHGALIAGVSEGPAKASGLVAGDVVVKFDGHDINEVMDFAHIVASAPIGKVVDVVIVRQGIEQTLHLRIGRYTDAQKAPNSDKPGFAK